jgi:hypothetical protein
MRFSKLRYSVSLCPGHPSYLICSAFFHIHTIFVIFYYAYSQRSINTSEKISIGLHVVRFVVIVIIVDLVVGENKFLFLLFDFFYKLLKNF